MNKKILLSLICGAALLLFAACGGQTKSSEGSGETAPAVDDGVRLTVVATLFPPYDFARAVGGERVTVSKMIPAGTEAHTYEPTPADIIAVDECDVFLYTNDAMEPWIASLRDSLAGGKTVFVETGAGIEYLHDADEHDQQEAGEGSHEEAYDPHVWTDPTLAMVMVDAIAAAFAEADPEGAEYYAANAESYKAELAALDDSFRELVAGAQRTELVFGGNFAFLYFCQHYGLTYRAAFDSCSGHAEPSAKRVAELIDEIKDQQIPVIYYEELSEPRVAQSIADETGAKTLLLHSCHNVSKEDMDSDVTYLELMNRNLDNLREGLY